MKMLKSWLTTILGTVAILGTAPVYAATQPDPIHIDIPVHFKNNEAYVVFNLDHPAFVGDHPVGMLYMHLLADHMKAMGTKGKIIGVFHGPAAYMVLNDKAYDEARHVTTGNPYAQLVAGLEKQGVQIEECGYSMKVHHWGNANLLPGVLVNSGAIGRITQLVQEGYVQIQP
ncbi:MAG: DsrE family protein [Betaproteobacteria bacterium]|nr:DsrE family protein [Betaproteobacteria bacterium]